ncbi:uncharacterized protein A4U43_C01F5910 [Asparagus officinalis]|uniref:2-oxoglutarate-dependent dioxygenase DAO n=1 Tax=Asparagus officinalis TaxID=4686 RepID=A0A5P1FMW2_ASPOF|nr:probable inactive 2-oxoglutarate-dependent dioxygenase AOP2 [Asparagus officinalis]ONK79394.1 uncharacterized protein A4U43_C01F5910 [Asparagus officinalis]
MGSVENKHLRLPLIDFSDLDPQNPATQKWAIARSQISQALEAHGCFEVIYDRVGPELRQELFGRVMPELFDLPLEAKQKNSSCFGKYTGYIGQIPGLAYESLRVDAAATVEGLQGFERLLWPQGNPRFCNTVWTYAKHMQELAKMVHRIVLESLGVEKYYDYHIQPKTSALRFSEYDVPLDQETKTGMFGHLDPNMLTIICQHKEGLEVQTKEGEWIHVVPLTNSFTVLIGEAFKVWTNGKFQPPIHRVNMIGDEKRYSVLFATRPSDDYLLEPLEELVDGDHPLLFKPLKYKDYITFRYSEEGRKCKNPLEGYCGVRSKVEA